MNAKLDCTEKKGRYLKTHFTKYPNKQPQTIFLDQENLGIRFYMTPDAKDIGQTMLYSNFAIAGDFEISATFEWVKVDPPATGYGASCGIAIETEGAAGSVQFTRVNMVGKGEGFTVTHGIATKDKPGIDYKLLRFEADNAKKGRLVLKRVRSVLTLLAGDGTTEELAEIDKIKPGDATIKKLAASTPTRGARRRCWTSSSATC